MPETCVHRVRSGSFIQEIDEGVHIAHPLGDSMVPPLLWGYNSPINNTLFLQLPKHPECSEWLKQRRENKTSPHRAGTHQHRSISSGWLDYVEYSTSLPVYYFSFANHTTTKIE